MSAYPSRIVCLSAEAVDVLYRIGCGERIVGVTRYAEEPPEARDKPMVGGFSDTNYEKIDALKPGSLSSPFPISSASMPRGELMEARACGAGDQPACSLQEVFDTILLIGRVVGREQARRKNSLMKCETKFSKALKRHV